MAGSRTSSSSSDPPARMNSLNKPMIDWKSFDVLLLILDHINLTSILLRYFSEWMCKALILCGFMFIISVAG